MSIDPKGKAPPRVTLESLGVLQVVSPFPPARDGIANYSKRLTEGLRNAGATVIVTPVNRGVDIIKVLLKVARLRPDVLRLEYAIATYGLAGIFLLVGLVGLRKQDSILTINCHEVARETDRLGPVARALYRWLGMKCDRLYVHTQVSLRTLIDECGVIPDKVRMIPHGTSDFPVGFTSHEAERAYDLQGREVVVFFGFITVDKGIEDLVAAIHLVVTRNPIAREGLCVLIAGEVRRRRGVAKVFEWRDRRYWRHIVREINRLGLAATIRAVGYVPDELVAPLLARARMVVMPYRSAEQSGVLNMAIAAGTPVVATSVGGLNEALADVGNLVPPCDPHALADAIVTLLEDHGVYDETRRRYAQLHQAQSTKAVVRALADDLASLVEWQRATKSKVSRA